VRARRPVRPGVEVDEEVRVDLHAQGNIAEALRVYERLRTLLREELGAAPAPMVQQVHERPLTHSTTS
jgi:DNA-binding SARP family transcriptional activator